MKYNAVSGPTIHSYQTAIHTIFLLTTDPVNNHEYSLVTARATSSKLEINLVKDGFLTAPNAMIGTVEVYGLKRRVSNLSIDNGNTLNFTFNQNNVSV